MDINQDIKYQKQAIDLSQLNLPKRHSENKTAAPKGTDPEISIENTSDASTVNLSEKGREASLKFDFNATTENLLKLDALGSSKSFSKAHASVSYENVKRLIG